ncbi:MAG: glycosyltransferase family A protein [Dokdonella sp.]
MKSIDPLASTRLHAYAAASDSGDYPVAADAGSASRSDCWLSILIPAYNVGLYLEECLTSITRQLAPGVEIVVVDDASTDNSPVILGRFEILIGTTLRVVTLANNAGLAAARNRLLREARGNYCWFVDGDDVMCLGTIRSLRRIIASASVDLVMCDFRVQREHFRLKHRLRGEAHRRTFTGPSRQHSSNHDALVAGLLMAGQLHPWSKIARREVWQSVRFPEGRYFEDITALPRLVRLVRSHIHVPEPWIGYRQRDGSILSEITPGKIRDQLRALGDLASNLDLPAANPRDKAGFALRHFLLRSHASLARRLVNDPALDAATLREEVCESLLRNFPDGPGATLRDYRRRGWFLRGWRARRSLRGIGFRDDANQ